MLARIKRAAGAVFDIASFGMARTGLLAYSQFYEGANSFSRERTYINPIVGDTEDTLNAYTRTEMLALARNCYANVGFVRGAVNDIARYTIGTGIMPQPQLKNPDTAKAYKEYWTRFSNRCEVSGKFTFPHLCGLLSRAVDVDGDIGIIFTETETRFPQLQAVEAHRIGDPPGKFETKDGVKLGPFGRPLSYRVVLKRNQYLDIPAESFHLLYDPDRCDAYRGASALAHALNNIRDKKDILGFEKTGVKNASSIANVITSAVAQTGAGFFSAPTVTGAGTTNELTTEKIRGGLIPKLLPGEKLEAFNSSRPSPTFTGFLGYIDRDVAVGLGVPVEFIWDTQALGGASQRFVLEKAQRRFCERQDSPFFPFIIRVYLYVIARGIANGDLPFDSDWFRVTLQRPSKITVDVGREADANRNDVAAGMRTMQEDYAERGLALWDARADNQEAARDLFRRADELVKEFPWLTHEAALAQLEKRGAQQIVLETSKPEKPQPEKK